MTKKKIITGDIIRIPLWNKFGFAYATYIDLSKYPNVNMPSLIKVYNYWTKTKDFNIDNIKNSDYLIQPILVAGIFPALQKKLWEIVEHIDVTGVETELPHFRTYEPRWDIEENAKEWYYIEDCTLERRKLTDLENIKHLERWGAIGTGNIEIRITMQILKKEGLSIENYFDMEDETVQYQYKIAQESPLLSEIPDSLHGKAKI